MKKIRKNFKYPKITKEHYRLGSNQVVGTVLNIYGDWRGYLPPEENQNKNGVESSACYIEAQQHTISTIFDEQYKITDSNYSGRFNSILSGGTENGGDPLAGADSIRNDGLIQESTLPFGDSIKSWADFHSWKGSTKSICVDEGKKFKDIWDLKYDIVFEKTDNLDTKYSQLKEALTYSPVPMSVWGVVDNDGNYLPKPDGKRDTHFVECVYMDRNKRLYVWDTYSPFLKILPPNYNSDFALRWSIKKKASTSNRNILNIIAGVWQWFLKEKLIFRAFRMGLIDNRK